MSGGLKLKYQKCLIFNQLYVGDRIDGHVLMFQVQLASQAALDEKHEKASEANNTSKAEDLCVTSHHFEIALTQVSPSVSNLVSNN
jgi:hypothetical protein